MHDFEIIDGPVNQGQMVEFCDDQQKMTHPLKRAGYLSSVLFNVLQMTKGSAYIQTKYIGRQHIRDATTTKGSVWVNKRQIMISTLIRVVFILLNCGRSSTVTSSTTGVPSGCDILEYERVAKDSSTRVTEDDATNH